MRCAHARSLRRDGIPLAPGVTSPHRSVGARMYAYQASPSPEPAGTGWSRGVRSGSDRHSLLVKTRSLKMKIRIPQSAPSLAVSSPAVSESSWRATPIPSCARPTAPSLTRTSTSSPAVSRARTASGVADSLGHQKRRSITRPSHCEAEASARDGPEQTPAWDELRACR